MATTRLFLYGTLKRGGGNWRWLLKDKAKYVGPAILGGATMYHLGGFPAIALNGNNDIHGELFDVDDDVLADCDQLEGHPRWYIRTLVKTNEGYAETYVMNQLNGTDTKVIADGVWPVEYNEENELIESL